MRKLGIKDKFIKTANFESMSNRKKEDGTGSEEFEILKLKKRIEDLEKQVQTAEMKAVAFSTMVDFAECPGSTLSDQPVPGQLLSGRADLRFG